MPTYFFSDGRPSRHPITREHAIEVKSPRYNDGEKCPTCNIVTPKYTSNDNCVHCCRKNALNFYNFYKGAPHVWTDEATGEHLAQPERNGKIMTVDDGTWSHWSKIANMIKDDPIYTVSIEACKQHGHIGVKRLGKCQECYTIKNEPSPRQAAIALGEKYFLPRNPCPRCHTIAPKRINGSVCTGCINTDVTLTDGRETPDTIMMRDDPTMIISKIDADDFGFKVYRTGNPCRKGHNGWRYVSTGNCIDCLKEG